MPRQYYLIRWPIFVLMSFILMSAAPLAALNAQSLPSQAASLNRLKAVVVGATGYDPATVEVAATKVQLIVTIVNSPLNGGSDGGRRKEARRIASTLAQTIRNDRELNGVQAIHVDYLKREDRSGREKIIDSIDFRKDPRGIFRHHVT